MKIAVVGTHGSGKSVICSELFAKLKRHGISLNLMTEVARDSFVLAVKGKSPEAQMDMFASQIQAELRKGLDYDFLITDRSVLDILMYTELFFPEHPFVRAMRNFVPDYVKTYDFMFRTSNLYNPHNIDDHLRPKEKELQLEAHRRLTKILDEFYPNYYALPHDRSSVDFIIGKMQPHFKFFVY